MSANQSEGRRPDYIVAALCKQNEHRGNIGAAWKNKDLRSVTLETIG